MSAHRVDLCVVLSDTRRIIQANRGHFLALSLLFILPLSLSAIVYPSLLKPASFISAHTRISSSFVPVPQDGIPRLDKSSVILPVICSPFELLFSFFTTSSITRSILSGFLGEPLEFTSSLKSILVSFYPLTVTYVVSRLIMGLFIFAVAVLAGILYRIAISPSWAGTDFGHVYYLCSIILVMVSLMGVMIYFQLKWYLADVIVVVESKWGLAPLERSSCLVKGMGNVASSIVVLYTLLLGIMPAFFSSSAHTPINGGSISWMLAFRNASFIVIATILRLYTVAATAVLFIHCKKLRGDEFDRLYVDWCMMVMRRLIMLLTWAAWSLARLLASSLDQLVL